MRIAPIVYANPSEIIPLLRHNEVTEQTSPNAAIQPQSESTSVSFQYLILWKNNYQVKLPCGLPPSLISTFKPVMNVIVPWRRVHLLWNLVTLLLQKDYLYVIWNPKLAVYMRLSSSIQLAEQCPQPQKSQDDLKCMVSKFFPPPANCENENIFH